MSNTRVLKWDKRTSTDMEGATSYRYICMADWILDDGREEWFIGKIVPGPEPQSALVTVERDVILDNEGNTYRSPWGMHVFGDNPVAMCESMVERQFEEWCQQMSYLDDRAKKLAHDKQ